MSPPIRRRWILSDSVCFHAVSSHSSPIFALPHFLISFKELSKVQGSRLEATPEHVARLKRRYRLDVKNALK